MPKYGKELKNLFLHNNFHSLIFLWQIRIHNFPHFQIGQKLIFAILFSRVRISVIILDENDNEPVFQALPYKASIREDLAIGSILFQGK